MSASLAYAQKEAAQVVAALAPFCDRIEVAGSVRRQCATVNDIEIVCIPRSRDLLQFARAVEKWTKLKGAPIGKYTRRRLPSGMELDIFMCNAQTWGCIYLIRTGCAEFCKSMMRQSDGMVFREGRLYEIHPDDETWGEPIDTPEEEDVFRSLEMPWVPPERRTGALHQMAVRR